MEKCQYFRELVKRPIFHSAPQANSRDLKHRWRKGQDPGFLSQAAGTGCW